MQSCKTCKYLAVPLNARGRIVVRSNSSYECVCVVSMPPLPDSVTASSLFRGVAEQRYRTYMGGQDGTNCPTWELREKTGD